ncbi:hypothetical protein C8A00DRAFT_15712 [Chaetomidium leptoderma]|uniref:Uncharacterized protein n=1 Tax=Chaetomidium leptoderma TaxID=669021 RepID=A0AAN6ZWM6_9PEZI|nr:hypothetical protein C8A00DRAFT_15712 [Chaetomidium leptoderma]
MIAVRAHCAKVKARIEQKKAPRSGDICEIRRGPEQRIPIKCQACHKTWTQEQSRDFDNQWKRYLAPMVEAHPRLQEHLQRVMDNKREKFDRELIHEWKICDQTGCDSAIYDTHPKQIQDTIKSMVPCIDKWIYNENMDSQDPQADMASQNPQSGHKSDGSSCPGSGSGSGSGSCSGSQSSGGRSKSSQAKHSKSGNKSGRKPQGKKGGSSSQSKKSSPHGGSQGHGSGSQGQGSGFFGYDYSPGYDYNGGYQYYS